MKYYVVAGEPSGDLHGSNLIRELKKLDKDAVIRCWGGDMMQAAGGELVKHYRELAFMGFIEVVKNIRKIFRNLSFCKEDITQFRPDALILIDYPGFNLRIAKWARQAGFKVIYYISPQVWAWKEKRVKLIREVVDKMLVILPFEEDFYRKWDYKVVYVGHPLVEIVETELRKERQPVAVAFPDGSAHYLDAGREVIGLLPGSRKQEIRVKLPVMLETTRHFPEQQFVVSQAPGQPLEFYLEMVRNFPNVQIARAGQTYLLLRQCRAALVTSGTATLETALFRVPQVVCYKGSRVSYFIARRLIKIKYIALVNLIMDKPVVKELIQHELTPANLQRELNSILTDQARIQQIKNDYNALWTLLRQKENASAHAAEEVWREVGKSGTSLEPRA